MANRTIGRNLDSLRNKRREEEEEETKVPSSRASTVAANLDALREANRQKEFAEERASLPSFKEALYTDSPEVQRERLKNLTARNLAAATVTEEKEEKTAKSSLPSVSDLVDSLPSVKAPSADHLRAQVNKNTAAKKQGQEAAQEREKSDALNPKNVAASISSALPVIGPSGRTKPGYETPLTARNTPEHNLGTYALMNFAAGVETGLTGGVRALENVLYDITTGGKRSENMQKLTTYFQENPTAQKALMTSYGTDESIAVGRIAKKAGVDPASVKGYKTQLSLNYYKQEADQWAEDEDINAVAKFVFGDAAYQIGMQLPGMAAGMALPGGGASASLTETVRNAVAGKSGTAFAKALGQGFVKGVGNAAKGNTTTWLMAANSAGSKFFENQRLYGDDVSVAQNILDSAANGFFESFTEGIGGFSDVPTIGKFFDTRTGSTAGTIFRTAMKGLLGMAEEGLEEVLNVPLGGIADKMTVDNDKKWFGDGGVFDGKEMLVSGLQGALIGGLMGSAATVMTVADVLHRPDAQKASSVEAIGMTAASMNPAEISLSVDLLNRESEKFGLEKLDANKTTPEMLETRAAEILDNVILARNEDLLSRKDDLIDRGLATPEGTATHAYALELSEHRDTVTAKELDTLVTVETQRINEIASKVAKETVNEITKADAALPSQKSEAQTAESEVQETVRSEQMQRQAISDANDGATVVSDLAQRFKNVAPNKTNMKTAQKLADAIRMIQQGQMPDKSYNEVLNLLKSEPVRRTVELELLINASEPVSIDTKNTKTIRASLQTAATAYANLAAQAETDTAVDTIAEAVTSNAIEREVIANTSEVNPITSEANAEAVSPNADVNAIKRDVNQIASDVNADVNADVVRSPGDTITTENGSITRAEFVRNFGAELAQQGLAADDVFDNYIRAEREAIANTSEVNTNASEVNAEAVTPAEGVSRETISPNANTSEVNTTTSPRLHIEYNPEKPLTEIQRTSVEALDRLASAVNVDIYLYDSTETSEYGDSSGRYDVKADRVYIDINAGSQYEGTILRTASHELTHFIKRWSPEEFGNLSRFVEQTLVNNGADISSLVSEKILEAAAHGSTRSREVAYEEVIADACQIVLTDTGALTELAETNKTLFDKIMEFFRDFIDRVRGVYADYKPTTEGGRILAQQTQDVLDQLSATYATALVHAGEARTAAQKLLAGEQSKLDDAKTPDGGSLFDYRAIEADLPKYKQMLTDWGGMTDAQVKTLFETIDTTIDIVSKNLEALDYGTDTDLNAERPFKPVKPNSDKLYKISLDFSTLCRKRIVQGIVAEKLQEQLKRPLSKEESIEVRNRLVEIQKEGLQIEVACALCYVEAARLKSPKQLEKFMNSRGAVLHRYYALQDRATKDKINAVEKQKKADLGYKENEKVKKAADKRIISEAKWAIMDAYQPTEAEQAEIDFIASDAVNVNTFTTADGLSDLAKNHPAAYAAYSAALRSATHSKGLEADVPWRAGDSAEITDSLIAAMAQGAGIRSQSWSDFQVMHLLDEIAMTIEMASRGAAMHEYTKVPDAVRLLGLTGRMLNMSLIPTRDGNGFDGVEGMPYETMLTLRNQYPDTAGNICIGVKDDQIRRLLASDEIDYVIPYHKSGNSKATRKLLKIPEWADYEGIQSERGDGEKPAFAEWFDLAKTQETAARENASPTDHAAKEKYGVQYGAYKAMQEAADRYLEICAERNLTPKFKGKVEGRMVDFTTEPNYWKLLIDRKMVNQITGEIIEQKPIQPIFDPEVIYGDMRNGSVGGILGRAIAEYPTLAAHQNTAVEMAVNGFLTDRGLKTESVAEEITEAAEELFEYRNPNEVEEDYPFDIETVDDDILPWDSVPSQSDTDVEASPYDEYADDESLDDFDRFAIAVLKGFNDEKRVAERDAKYTEAVAKMDMDTAAKMVEESAQKAGYTSPKLYHGTKSFGFTKLNPRMSDDRISFFSTSSLDLAQTYSGKQTTRELWEGNDAQDSVTKSKSYAVVDSLIIDAGREKATADEVLEKATAELMTIATNLTRKVNTPYLAIEDDAPRVAKKIADLVAEYDLIGAKWALDDFAAEADEILETVFGNGKNGNYQFYANTDGFLEIDAQGSYWSNIDYQPPELLELWASHKELEKQRGVLMDQAKKIKSEQGILLSEAMERVPGLAKIDDQISDLEDIIYNSEDYQMFTGDLDTRGLSKYAHDHGYQGVLIKNLKDEGGRGLFDSYDAGDVYIFFDPAKQLKSADPVTYDDNGKVIPLSQRFNAGNDDIRFEHRDIATSKAFQDFVKAYDAVHGAGAANTIVRTTEQFDRERARQRKREATAAQMAKIPDTQKHIAAEVKRLESDRRERAKIESLQNPATRKRRLAAQKNRAQMRELLAAAKMNADMRVADQAYRDNYEMQLRLAEATKRAEERLKKVSNNLRVKYEGQILRSEQKRFEAQQKAEERLDREQYQAWWLKRIHKDDLARERAHGRERLDAEVQRTKDRYEKRILQDEQKRLDAQQRAAEQQRRRTYADWWEENYFRKPEAEQRAAERKERQDYQRDMARLLQNRDRQILRDNADVRDAQKAYTRDLRTDPEALRNRNNGETLQRAAVQEAQHRMDFAARQNAAAQRTGAEVISPTDAVQKAPILEGPPPKPASVEDIMKKGSAYNKTPLREKIVAVPDKVVEGYRGIYRNWVNAAQGIDNISEKQREAGFNVTASDLTTSVRNSKDTAAYILTDALVSRSGEVLGKSLSDVILVKDRKGRVSKKGKDQNIYDTYLKLNHTVDRMSVMSNALAQFEEYVSEHEWLRTLFPTDSPAPIDTRSATFVEKLLGRSEEEIAEAHTAANLYNQYAEAENKPVYGTVDYVDVDGKKQVREIHVMSAQEAQDLVDIIESEQPWVKQKAAEYYEWMDTFMREWAVGTSITLEDYETMHRLYPHYVPTYREGKDAGAAASARGGKVSSGQAVKRATGGVSEVRWVQDTLAEQVGRLVTLRRTNDLLLNLVDTGLIDGSDTLGTGIRIRPESLGYGALMNYEEMDKDDNKVVTRAISNEGGKYTISAWDNGERITADIDEGLYESLLSLFPQSDKIGKLTRAGRRFSTPQKAFLTGYNPNFFVRNVMRDFATALIQTEGSMGQYVKHYALAYKYIRTNDVRWQEYQALGNTGSQRYRDDVGLAQFNKIMTPGGFQKALNKIGSFGETTEAAARFAEYLLVAEKEGFTPEAKLHASKAAAEITTDFSRSGDYGRLLNAWVPYTNAATQGVDRVLRDFKNGKGWTRIRRAAIVQALPQALFLLAVIGLGREEEYKGISDYQKDNYYLFPVPGMKDKWIRFPKTETYGKVLGSGLSRIVEAAWGREDPINTDAFDTLGESFNASWLGNFVEGDVWAGLADMMGIRDLSLFGAGVDLMLNEDFSGREIIGSEFKDFTSDEKAPRSEQYNSDTSAVAYLLARAIGNAISPEEMDYLMSDYFGDFYHGILDLVNVGMLQEFDTKDLVDNLKNFGSEEFVNAWVVDSRYSNRYTSDYYDALDKLGSTIAGERVRISDPDERSTTLAYRTRQAVNYAYGDAISDAYKTARSAVSKAQKDDAREEAVALSIEALDFIERALAGEYGSNPYDYVKYEIYGDSVAKALLALDSFKKGYQFEPDASYAPKDLVVGKGKHVLTNGEKDAYKAMYVETYAELAQEAINSKKYRNASDKERAKLLEDVASDARDETRERFIDWLK